MDLSLKIFLTSAAIFWLLIAASNGYRTPKWVGVLMSVSFVVLVISGLSWIWG